MADRSSILKLISEAAPAMTIGALLLMPILLPNHAEITHTAELRQGEIREALDRVPLTIGAWIGTDVEVPRAAIEMLHTTAILSRRYDRLPQGPMVSVLMVHCTDTRDMLGHYPPVCYPSNGWTADNAQREETEFDLIAGDLMIPVSEFRYARPLEYGRAAQIRIFNFFILPDGTLTRNMDDIRKKSERMALAVQGAAQVQVITVLDLPRDQALLYAGELLSGMDDLFNEFRVAGEAGDA